VSADSGEDATRLDATAKPAEEAKTTPRQRLLGWVFSLAWAANLALLAIAVTWIATDGQFMEPAGGTIESTAVLPAGANSSSPRVGVMTTTSMAPMSPERIRAFNALGTGAALTLAIMLVGLFVGATRQRRLRSWLTFTAVVAAWLGLLVGWPELAWAGKTYRTRRVIDQFEPVAAALRENWPVADDYTELLGPFSAYPNGRPTILMPLLKPSARGSHAPFGVIERSQLGALRFELLGPDAGAWLEWHPDGSKPASFTGGLETEYQLHRATPLVDGWYLTRYHAAGLAKSL
jgi:hypothetical protein